MMCLLRSKVRYVIVIFAFSLIFGDIKLGFARPSSSSSESSSNNANVPSDGTKDIIENSDSPEENDVLTNGTYNQDEGARREEADKGQVFNVYGEMKIDNTMEVGKSITSTSKATFASEKGEINRIIDSATDMMLTDVRTPPKIKSQLAQSNYNFATPGKGEAIPIVIDDSDTAALEKIAADNFKYSHDSTTSGAMSTWVLLHSDPMTASYTQSRKPPKPVTVETVVGTSPDNITDKILSNDVISFTTEKIVKYKTDVKRPDRKPMGTVQKVNQTTIRKTTPKPDEEQTQSTTVIALQDSKFKNKTPVIVGKVPNLKEKIDGLPAVNISSHLEMETSTDKNTPMRLGTPVVTFPHIPQRVRPSIAGQTIKKNQSKDNATKLENITTLKPLQNQTQGIIISSESSIVTTSTAISTIETKSETETTTKKTKNSQKNKKKKNKKKKRKPSKKTSTKVQSKISEDENATSKLPGGAGNPLSTRIYNYLAREVVPNVGVGIVGLVLTAGLAGLLLYPFGAAVPVRRNYEKPNYGPDDYKPISEVDNAQPEESLMNQVLAGMNQGMLQYRRDSPDSYTSAIKYKQPSSYQPSEYKSADYPIYKSKPVRYDSHDYRQNIRYTPDGVSSDSDKYSELGDVVSGSHESLKLSNYDNNQPKYPDPSPAYSPNESQTEQGYNSYPTVKDSHEPSSDVKYNAVYPTSNDYTSYNNPDELIQNPTYSGDNYMDYKNHRTESPKKEQTTSSRDLNNKNKETNFEALEAIPKNYRVLDTSISLDDSVVSADEFTPSKRVYREGGELGPRKLRTKRNTLSENEVDSVLSNERMSSEIMPVSSESTSKSQTTISYIQKIPPPTKISDYILNDINGLLNNNISSLASVAETTLPNASQDISNATEVNTQVSNTDVTDISSTTADDVTKDLTSLPGEETTAGEASPATTIPETSPQTASSPDMTNTKPTIPETSSETLRGDFSSESQGMESSSPTFSGLDTTNADPTDSPTTRSESSTLTTSSVEDTTVDKRFEVIDPVSTTTVSTGRPEITSSAVTNPETAKAETSRPETARAATGDMETTFDATPTSQSTSASSELSPTSTSTSTSSATTLQTSASTKPSTSAVTKSATNVSTESTKSETSLGTTTDPFDRETFPPSQPPSSSFSISAIIRRILDFKIRLGLEFLRQASETISRYIGTVQERMATAFREMQKRNNHGQKVIKRERRDPITNQLKRLTRY